MTPTSYLELLGMFKKVLGIKKNEIMAAKNRTKTGLDKVPTIVHSNLIFNKMSDHLNINYLNNIFKHWDCGLFIFPPQPPVKFKIYVDPER